MVARRVRSWGGGPLYCSGVRVSHRTVEVVGGGPLYRSSTKSYLISDMGAPNTILWVLLVYSLR